jgi:hypothetical protein
MILGRLGGYWAEQPRTLRSAEKLVCFVSNLFVAPPKWRGAGKPLWQMPL